MRILNDKITIGTKLRKPFWPEGLTASVQKDLRGKLFINWDNFEQFRPFDLNPIIDDWSIFREDWEIVS